MSVKLGDNWSSRKKPPIELTSEIIAAQIREFEARGGKIEKLSITASSYDNPLRRAKNQKGTGASKPRPDRHCRGTGAVRIPAPPSVESV